MCLAGALDALASARESQQRSDVVAGRKDVARDRLEHVGGQDARVRNVEAVAHEPHEARPLASEHRRRRIDARSRLADARRTVAGHTQLGRVRELGK